MRVVIFIALLPLIAATVCLSDDLPLAGRWSSGCTPLIRRHSVQSVLHFYPDHFVAVHRLFADKECQILNLEIETKGEHRVENGLFHWTPIAVTEKVLNSEVLDLYNARRMCGYGNWKLGESKDIAGRFCEPNDNPEVGRSYADTVQIDASNLSFGWFPELPRDANLKSSLFAKPIIYTR